MITIASGRDFRLYHEDVFEPDCLYLELRNVAFTVTQDIVTVTVPLPLWQQIQCQLGADLSAASWRNEDIRRQAEQAVDRRVRLRRADRRAVSARLFGESDPPRNELVDVLVRALRTQRTHAGRLSRAISALGRERAAVGAIDDIPHCGGVIADRLGCVLHTRAPDPDIELCLQIAEYEVRRTVEGWRVRLALPIEVSELIREYPRSCGHGRER